MAPPRSEARGCSRGTRCAHSCSPNIQVGGAKPSHHPPKRKCRPPDDQALAKTACTRSRDAARDAAARRHRGRRIPLRVRGRRAPREAWGVEICSLQLYQRRQGSLMIISSHLLAAQAALVVGWGRRQLREGYPRRPSSREPRGRSRRSVRTCGGAAAWRRRRRRRRRGALVFRPCARDARRRRRRRRLLALGGPVVARSRRDRRSAVRRRDALRRRGS